MLLFGHRFIQSENFYHINTITAITKTPPNSLLFLPFEESNLDIIEHLRENDLAYGVSVTNIESLIYAAALQANYIILEKELAKSAQNIAENYLFDAKILLKIESEEEIAEAALLGIDGILFANAIIKVTS